LNLTSSNILDENRVKPMQDQYQHPILVQLENLEKYRLPNGAHRLNFF